jgi:hypothetical protein
MRKVAEALQVRCSLLHRHGMIAPSLPWSLHHLAALQGFHALCLAALPPPCAAGTKSGGGH